MSLSPCVWFEKIYRSLGLVETVHCSTKKPEKKKKKNQKKKKKNPNPPQKNPKQTNKTKPRTNSLIDVSENTLTVSNAEG